MVLLLKITMFAIKRELKLNNKEASRLAGCAGYSRFVYNYGLAMMKDSWSFEGVKASDAKRLGAIKKVFNNETKKRSEFAWCNAYSSRIYQNAFRDLASAFSRWRNASLKAEMPTFKRKRHECSFTVDSSSGAVLVQAGKSIKVPTLGTFRLKEAVPFNCISQTFTVSRKAGKWYVSFMVKACPLPAMKHTEKETGIDLGVKTFATLASGESIDSPASLKQAKAKLRRTQWKNRNKVQGNRKLKQRASNNAHRYYQQLRKQHKHIANIREDFLQKLTTRLGQTYQRIAIEDLNVRGMMANHKLADAIGNLGFYRFREMLTYKQPFHGFELTVVDRWFPSSKMDSRCGHIQSMPLKERVYCCGGCGHTIDRDHNAAINILNWPNVPTLPMAIGIRTTVERVAPTPRREAVIEQLNLFV